MASEKTRSTFYRPNESYPLRSLITKLLILKIEFLYNSFIDSATEIDVWNAVEFWQQTPDTLQEICSGAS